MLALTPAFGLGNHVSRTLAHHFGDVEWAVGLLGNGDCSVYSLGLYLKMVKGEANQNTVSPARHVLTR